MSEHDLNVKIVRHPYLRHLENVDMTLLDILRRRRNWRLASDVQCGAFCRVYFDNVRNLRGPDPR